jgi:muramoyltetrapeptide carboxypeptidase
VRVIAPSSPFDRALVFRGMGWLASRYRVEFAPSLCARAGYLAGSDERRLEELNAALRDPAVAAIVAARGGYGIARILHLADAAALREHPKWLVGFSDITALHALAWRHDVASLHASMVGGLGRGDAVARAAWRQALEAPGQARVLFGSAAYCGGRARGPLVGGNLTVLAAVALAGLLALPEGCILALEDINEAPYSVDRLLSALHGAGALRPVAAVALGEFTDCKPGHHGVPVEEVLRERLALLRVPVLAGLPFGHGRRNEPLLLGCDAELDASALELRMGALARP